MRLGAAMPLAVALFAWSTLPRMPHGPVVGTGQDEWYNAVRALKALHDGLDPSYFVHPALYYEILALLYAALGVLARIAGWIGAGTTFLDYFLAHEPLFLDLGRYLSFASGALAVAASVWLGSLLGGSAAGLLAGLLVATLPLLHALAVSIRVDALALAVLLAATALVVRHHQRPDRRSFAVAAAGIGVAAAANYPGALLLLLLGWLEWVRGAAPLLPRLAKAAALAFAVFLALNPYVVLDFGNFLFWFTFTVKVPFLVHPHAEAPSLTRYLMLLRDQGLPVIAACAIGAISIVTPRRAPGALAAFGIAHLAAFSVMQTQYERFVLPAFALLSIAGASWLCGQLGRVRPWVATAFGVAASLAVCGYSVSRQLAAAPDHAGPDNRAEMLAWIDRNVPPSATLVLESDTLPILQTIYDPGDQRGPFHAALQEAFERLHPRIPRRIVKTQFIAVQYNYDPRLLESGEVYFLASSRNRELIALNRAVLPGPAAFYDALDRRAKVVHESGGFHEKLVLYAANAG